MIPRLYIFNPDNDLALANNDENYLPPASARQMTDDLAALPVWWADEGDAVLVPAIAGVQQWQTDVEPLLPAVVWYSARQSPCFAEVRPWGWNRALLKRLRRWGIGDDALVSAADMERIRMRSSRRWAVELLPRLKFSEMFCGESCYCTSEDEIAEAVERYGATLLKAPYSSSGKGLRRGDGVYGPLLANWCRRTLKTQGGVAVEPIYNKVEDFAMEFYFDGREARFVGYSMFATDANGAYEGNWLASDEAMEERIARRVGDEPLRQLKAALPSLLTEGLTGSGYRGYLGVDMMVCHFIGAPEWRIHPCVEVNLRMNMGVVARLFYRRYLAEGATGSFSVSYHADSWELMEEYRRRQAGAPLQVADGRIVSGFLSLVPIAANTHYAAFAQVDNPVG